MASCDDLYQERQDLIKGKNKIEQDLTRIKRLQSSQVPDDEAIKNEMAGGFSDDYENLQKDGTIDDLIKDTYNEAKADPEVNIPAGQPTNFAQLIRHAPDKIVRDWALISKAFQLSGQRMMPDQWKFLSADVNRAANEMSETLQGSMSPKQIISLMEKDADSFNTAVEKTLRIRAFYQVSHKAFLDIMDDFEKFMATHEATKVPDDLRLKAIDTYKVALMSERQYDFIRNTWSRQGKAMQGGGFLDLELDIASDSISRSADESIDTKTVQEVRDMRPEDFGEESPIARLLSAADTFRTNKAEGLRQLELEIKTANIKGSDPFKIYDPSTWKDRMHRMVNVLAKDSQLWNLRTQGLNVGSNAVMALYGPARKLHEGAMYRPHGTSLMDGYYDEFQALFRGYGAATKALWGSGKEVWLDAWSNKSLHYAGQVDTYGKYFKSVDQQVQELEMLRDWMPKNKFRKALRNFNPEHLRRQMHANTRLWLYNKTKKSYFLRPGLTNLAAVDNVSGFFFHHYNLANDLEMRVRRDGVQLGLVDEKGKIDRKLANDWINEQMDEAMYKTEVTEKMRLQYRKEKGFTPDIVGDTEIEDLIREERTAKTYGAPVMNTKESREAAIFSEDMRFQGKPGEKNPGAGVYHGIDYLRKKNWVADIMFPYLQAPFKGASLDFTLTGIGPIADSFRLIANTNEWTPKQAARIKANYIMAAHVYATWGMLSSNGLIVGNGPVNPREYKEWRIKLEKEGKKPNSIGGVQLIGGIPVLSTIFLLEDIREASTRANTSLYDDKGLVDMVFTVLAGHLTRTTAVGNLKQFFDAAYGDQYGNRRIGQVAGYMASGQVYGVGPVREAERLLDAKPSQVYRPKEYDQEENELLDEFKLQQLESKTRDALVNLWGLPTYAGGKFKNFDWLGNPIRLTWGESFKRLKNFRFQPGEHPEGDEKVYPELFRLGLLDPPGPLLNRELDGVPMDEDMQQLYNQTYFNLKGNKAHYLKIQEAGLNPTYKFDPVVAETVIKSGLLKGQRNVLKMSDPDVDGEAVIWTYGNELIKHIHKKSPEEAFRSLFNSPFYKKLMRTKGISNDIELGGKTIFGRGRNDMTKKEFKEKLPYKLTSAIKQYYALLALEAFNVSDHPAAVKWRSMRTVMKSQKRSKEFIEFQETRKAGRSDQELEKQELEAIINQ